MAKPTDPRYPLIRQLETEGDILTLIRKLLTTAAEDMASTVAQMSPLENARAELYMASLQSSNVVLQQGIENFLENGIEQVFNTSMDAQMEMLRQQFVDMGLDSDMIESLMSSEQYRARSAIQSVMAREMWSKKRLSDQVWSTMSSARERLERTIQVGLVRGLSARDLAKQVRDFVSPTTPGGMSYAAMRLARTEINNAAHAANQEIYKRSGVVKEVEWHLSSSHPEGDICDDMAADSPYNVDEVPEKPHPQCFCYTTPALPSKDEFLKGIKEEIDKDESIGSAEAPESPSAPGSAGTSNDAASKYQNRIDNATSREAHEVVGLSSKYDAPYPDFGQDWDAINKYVADDDFTLRMNVQFRNGKTPKGVWVNRIDEAISKHEITTDTELWRGMALTPEEAASYQVGAEFNYLGWTSTDVHRDTAEWYASVRLEDLVESGQEGHSTYLLRMIPSLGTHVGVSGTELILERGTQWTVASIEDGVITIVQI